MTDMPSLLVFPYPSDVVSSGELLNGRIENYRRSTRWLGGFWEASWFFPVNKTNDDTYLLSWLDKLMHRFIERRGGIVTWQGLIWDVEITQYGVTRRVSVDSIANYVWCNYTDGAGDPYSSLPQSNPQSVARYGRHEHVIEANRISSSEADALVTSYLAMNAWPKTQIVGFNSTRQGVRVTAVGDVFTMSRRYPTQIADLPLSDHIAAIIVNDCEFVDAGVVQPNTFLTTSALGFNDRVWQHIKQLVSYGDGDKPYTFQVYGDGAQYSKAYYMEADPSPRYEWTKSGWASGGKVFDPWSMRPAVVRDMTRRKPSPLPGGFLTDSRDVIAYEIEMGDGFEFPMVKPEYIDPADIVHRVDSFLRQNERQTKNVTGNFGSSPWYGGVSALQLRHGSQVHDWLLSGSPDKPEDHLNG